MLGSSGMVRFHFALLAAASGMVTRKRGFSGFLDGGSTFTCDDASLLNLEDSFHYTWQAEYPTQNDRCHGQRVSAEFVPMFIGVTTCPIRSGSYESCVPELEKAIAELDSDDVRGRWKESGARYLMGYNEPDGGNGKHNHAHEVLPADAAAAWPKLQALAATMSPPLVLVSPSVASVAESGGSDAWDDNGHSRWMDEFFGNCTEVVEACDPELIEYIGMHDYHGSVDQLRRRVDGAAKRYGRKIWLSEVAWTVWGVNVTREMEDEYMAELLPYLDSSENVFRYTWYSSRADNGRSNLIAADNSLTSTGKIYRDTADSAQLLV